MIYPGCWRKEFLSYQQAPDNGCHGHDPKKMFIDVKDLDEIRFQGSLRKGIAQILSSEIRA
jgi:hypothetical protein